jgi:uncharacterized RDD family membrane protein YckC
MNRINNTARKAEKGFYGRPSFHTVSNRVYYEPAGGLLRLCAAIFDSYIIALALGVIFTLLISVAVMIFSLDPKGFLALFQELPQLAHTADWRALVGTAGVVVVGLPLSMIAIHSSYFALFESCYGKTPGKFLLGIAVHDADESLPRFGKAFARNLYKYLPFAVSFIGGLACILAVRVMVPLVPLLLAATILATPLVAIVGYGMVFFTEHKQMLHDKWTFLYVVKDHHYNNNLRIAFCFLAFSIVSLHLALSLANSKEQVSSTSSSKVNQTPYKAIRRGNAVQVIPNW